MKLNKCVAGLTQLVHGIGVPLFKNDYSNRRVYTIYFCFILNAIHTLVSTTLTIRAFLVWGWEEALGFSILILHFMLADMIMFRERKQVEEVLTNISMMISSREERFLKMEDKKLFRLAVGNLILYLIIYFMYMTIRLQYDDNFLNNKLLGIDDYPFIHKIWINIIVRIGITLQTYGHLCATMAYYVLIGLTFHAYSISLDAYLADVSRSEKDIDEQVIRNIRKRIVFYVVNKKRVEKETNVLPFLWLLSLMTSLTLFATKLITDVEKEMANGESVFISNLYFVAVYVMALVKVMRIRETSDQKFKECLEKLVTLLGNKSERKKQIDTSIEVLIAYNKKLDYPYIDSLILNRQMSQLESEVSLLLNRALSIDSTVAGIVIFDRNTLVSFAGHVVNFSVMVISIRNAYQTSPQG